MDIDSLNNKLKICFVLPTYNEEENIENIIKQILDEERNQSTDTLSILVVDDNSSDETQDIVKGLISLNQKRFLRGQRIVRFQCSLVLLGEISLIIMVPHQKHTQT